MPVNNGRNIKKLSKVETLRAATQYIKYLQQVLSFDPSSSTLKRSQQFHVNSIGGQMVGHQRSVDVSSSSTKSSPGSYCSDYSATVIQPELSSALHLKRDNKEFYHCHHNYRSRDTMATHEFSCSRPTNATLDAAADWLSQSQAYKKSQTFVNDTNGYKFLHSEISW